VELSPEKVTMNNIKSWAEDDSLVTNYAEFVMDSMDMKTMEQFVYDTLVQEYLGYKPEELISEIIECYGEEWFTDRDIVVPLKEVAQ
jgi:hypothetical protein